MNKPVCAITRCMDKPHVTALRRAISVSGGTQVAFAELLAKAMKRPTIGQQTVSYWLNNAVLLDPEYWPAIEEVTNREVTRADLRPDVFNDGKAA